MAADAPNIAALHQRGPRSASATVNTMPATHDPPTTIQPRLPGTPSPPVGAEKARKPARPADASPTPSHSRGPVG